MPIPVTPDLKSVSPAGKILYSLMLYRMQLSKSRPEWIDEDGEPFIYYSLKDVMNDISCGEKKALQIFKELEEAHLIRRHSQCQFSTPRIYIPTNRSDEA
ncbi:replication initiator protein A [Butyricicoccus sp. AM05-1]|uniref:replication initiator protein A n=1 Tax=Butyricicoccus sp. AM05-1 TaxID=2292004 RepID=UPI003FA487A8